MIIILLYNALSRISTTFPKRIFNNNNNKFYATTNTPTSPLSPSSCLSSVLHNNNISTLGPDLQTNLHYNLTLLRNYCSLRQISSHIRQQFVEYKYKRSYSIYTTKLPHNNYSSIQDIQSPQIAFNHHQRRTMAKIISGREVSGEIRANLKTVVEGLTIKPKLAIVQVGCREDSNVYIKMKCEFAESIGASAELIKFNNDATENQVAEKVKELNQDPTIHGIITQLPFDTVNKIDSDMIVNLVDPKKDVDGLSVYNAGKLSHGELSSTYFLPCTPNGCMELIKRSGIQVAGTRSVVIGRSKIVGSPMALLLLWHNSTVTICHSKTKNIESICREADIIVAAVGQPQMVKRSWLKPGAVVIDCGINAIPDATKKSGCRLVGDVDFDECKEVASAITPVPGGVGPMTVAMLISNTVKAAERASSC